MKNGFTFCDYNDDKNPLGTSARHAFPRHCGAQGPRRGLDVGCQGFAWALLTGHTRSEEELLQSTSVLPSSTGGIILDTNATLFLRALYKPEATEATHFRVELRQGGLTLKRVVLPFDFHDRSEVALLATQWYIYPSMANPLAPYQRSRFWTAPIAKLPSDLLLYAEIMHRADVRLVVEFGSLFGGSAMFFATLLRGRQSQAFKVLTVDIDSSNLESACSTVHPTEPCAMRDPDVEVLTSSSAHSVVAKRIEDLKAEYAPKDSAGKNMPASGAVLAILDSLHTAEHVYKELELIFPLLGDGDFLIVEDGLPCGYPLHNPGSDLECADGGPLVALKRHLLEHPSAYHFDRLSQAVPETCPPFLRSQCRAVAQCYSIGCTANGVMRSDGGFAACLTGTPMCDSCFPDSQCGRRSAPPLQDDFSRYGPTAAPFGILVRNSECSVDSGAWTACATSDGIQAGLVDGWTRSWTT